ncbi:MAG: phage holin family protein [Bacteroidia bacterium]|nr:phage holin family protein [Bacteroidia bacterium]
MWQLIINTLVMAVSIMLGAYLLKGVEVKSFGGAVGAAFLLGIANATLGNLLNFILSPFNAITLGLISWLVSALMIVIVSKMFSGFKVKNFGWAMVFGLALGIINGLLSIFF